MKKIGLILLIVSAMSCATTEKYGLILDDELILTRKFVGNFIDYWYTGPTSFGLPNTVWIRTSQDSIYGKISVYCRKCEFEPGERLYIRRAYQSPGIGGYWMYQIENENENKVWYKLSEFQDGNGVLAQSFR